MIRLNNNITTIIELGHGDVGICPDMQEVYKIMEILEEEIDE